MNNLYTFLVRLMCIILNFTFNVRQKFNCRMKIIVFYYHPPVCQESLKYFLHRFVRIVQIWMSLNDTVRYRHVYGFCRDVLLECYPLSALKIKRKKFIKRRFENFSHFHFHYFNVWLGEIVERWIFNRYINFMVSLTALNACLYR